MNSTEDHAKKILQVTIGDGSFGGVASFLYTYYSHMDHSKIHFDFLYCGENSMQSKEGESVLYGSEISTLHILKRNNNGLSEYMRLLPAFKRVFAEKRYDIVHVNSSNLFLNVCVAYALKGRAKLIAHSHNTQATIEYSSKLKSTVKSLIRKPCTSYIIKKADALFACSKAAGLNLFGMKGIKSNNFKIIHNAIDLSKYVFSEDIREIVRNGEDKLILGHVGRLTDQKNPLFVIDVFNALHERNPKSVLWMVGEGELKEEIEKKIEALRLADSVRLLGRRDDVPELMQAMDVFLFPSLYEGLSIVTIEAQAAGLPIFASDSISPEHKVTPKMQFIGLSKKPNEWASEILDTVTSDKDRNNTIDDLIRAGYEITSAAKELEETYLRM